MCSSSLCCVALTSKTVSFFVRFACAKHSCPKTNEKRKEQDKNEVNEKKTNTKSDCCWHSSLCKLRCSLSLSLFTQFLALAPSPRRCITKSAENSNVLYRAPIHTINKFVIVADDTNISSETKWKWWILVCLLFGSDRESIIYYTRVYACVRACLRVPKLVLVENYFALTNGRKENRFEWEWDWNWSQIAIEQIKIYLQFRTAHCQLFSKYIKVVCLSQLNDARNSQLKLQKIESTSCFVSLCNSIESTPWVFYRCVHFFAVI